MRGKGFNIGRRRTRGLRMLARVLHLAAFAGAVLAGAPAHAAAPLEILVEEAAWLPFNVGVSGYTNDVLHAAFAAAGTEVALKVVPSPGCQGLVQAGRAAACLSQSWKPPFAGNVKVSAKPVFSVHPTYYRPAASSEAVQSEAMLPSGTRVGLVNGYEYPESTLRLASRGVIFEYAPSESATLAKLATHRLDYAVLMHTPIKPRAEVLTAAKVTDKVAYAFEARPVDSYIGFSTLHSKGDSARAAFERGVSRIAADGTLSALQHKWAQRSPPAGPPEFTVCSHNLPPHTMPGPDGRPAGMATEILMAVAKRLDWTLDIQYHPWMRVRAYAALGRCDLIYTLLKKPEYEAFAVFPREALSDRRNVIVVLRDSGIRYDGDLEAFMRTYRVGTYRDKAVSPLFDHLKSERWARVDYADTPEQNVQKLLSGRFDALIENSATAAYLLQQNGRVQETQMLEPPLLVTPSYIAFSQHGKALPYLADFDRALRDFKATREYRRIIEQYGS